MYRLHTSAAEVAQALLGVMRRGSLRAAEEITGHTYETIGAAMRQSSHTCGCGERVSMRSWEVDREGQPYYTREWLVFLASSTDKRYTTAKVKGCYSMFH